MTSEEDFQRQLDEHPEDFQTRLMFADWLEEHDDPRAEGYRALGVNAFAPHAGHSEFQGSYWWSLGSEFERGIGGHALPDDWFVAIDFPQTLHGLCKPRFKKDRPSTRREVEDAAALAFAKLPALRRAELLAAVPA